MSAPAYSVLDPTSLRREVLRLLGHLATFEGEAERACLARGILSGAVDHRRLGVADTLVVTTRDSAVQYEPVAWNIVSESVDGPHEFTFLVLRDTQGREHALVLDRANAREGAAS